MTQIERKPAQPSVTNDMPAVPGELPSTFSDTSAAAVREGGILHRVRKFIEHTDPTAHPRHSGLRAVRYLRRLTDAYMNHQCGLMACAVAYCGILSLVPLIIVAVAILGFVFQYMFPGHAHDGRAHALAETVRAIQNYVPFVNVGFLREQLTEVLDKSQIMGIFGMTFLIWGAHQTFLALQPAMNLIWVVPETRHWFKQRMIALAATFFTLVLLSLDLAASYLTVQVADYSGHWLDSSVHATLLKILTGMLPVLITAILFASLYKMLPDRRVPWKAAFMGAAVAAFLWQITKVGFAYYLLNHSTGYTLLYGSLSAVVIFVVWMYYTMAILLLGAEIAADYEFMRHGRKAAEDRSHSGADLTSATYVAGAAARYGSEESRITSEVRIMQEAKDVEVAGNIADGKTDAGSINKPEGKARDEDTRPLT